MLRKDDAFPGELNMYLGVAQLVARYLGVVEAAGSSPVTQIMIESRTNRFRLYFFAVFGDLRYDTLFLYTLIFHRLLK